MKVRRDAIPARPRMLARARRTALVALVGLVAAVALLCWVATVVLHALHPGPGPAWTGVAHVLGLAAAVLLVGRAARYSTRFLEDTFEQEDQLLSAVAHEVRSPLSRLVVAVEEGLDGTISGVEALSVAHGEAKALAELIDDLVLAGKVMAGSVPVPQERVSLLSMAREVAATARTDDLEVVVEGDPVVVVGSVSLLRLALVNLVRNAVQHGCSGGSGLVQVRADRCGLAVLDTGPGVPQARLRALQRPPRLGVGPRPHGLGLLLAGWVAEMHGGTLQLANRPSGGFEARLALPVHPREEPAALAAPDDGELVHG